MGNAELGDLEAVGATIRGFLGIGVDGGAGDTQMEPPRFGKTGAALRRPRVADLHVRPQKRPSALSLPFFGVFWCADHGKKGAGGARFGGKTVI